MEVRVRHTVAVIGGGEPEQELPDVADQLGAWIARRGYNLLTGGGGGVMTSVSRGFCSVEDRQSVSIGIIPSQAEMTDGSTPKPKQGYPNPYIEIPILSHLPYSGAKLGTHPLSRNHINILSACIVIQLPGGWGTTAEADLADRYRVERHLLSSVRELEAVKAKILAAIGNDEWCGAGGTLARTVGPQRCDSASPSGVVT